jgi:hypothetical protein
VLGAEPSQVAAGDAQLVGQALVADLGGGVGPGGEGAAGRELRVGRDDQLPARGQLISAGRARGTAGPAARAAQPGSAGTAVPSTAGRQPSAVMTETIELNDLIWDKHGQDLPNGAPPSGRACTQCQPAASHLRHREERARGARSCSRPGPGRLLFPTAWESGLGDLWEESCTLQGERGGTSPPQVAGSGHGSRRHGGRCGVRQHGGHRGGAGGGRRCRRCLRHYCRQEPRVPGRGGPECGSQAGGGHARRRGRR